MDGEWCVLIIRPNHITSIIGVLSCGKLQRQYNPLETTTHEWENHMYIFQISSALCIINYRQGQCNRRYQLSVSCAFCRRFPKASCFSPIMQHELATAYWEPDNDSIFQVTTLRKDHDRSLSRPFLYPVLLFLQWQVTGSDSLFCHMI